MRGIDYRLLRAFLFVIFLVVVTNFNYIFGKKSKPEPEPEPEPEPAPGPTPAPEPPAKEEPSKKTVEAVKTTLTAEVQAAEQLPKTMTKKEGYISYSDI
jgi:ABC-type uncharacterized transport system involved in gliding motility auxiliary subunit